MTRQTRQAARPHRHSWQAIAIQDSGRILEGCTVDRCTMTRTSDQRAVGLWDQGINDQAAPSGPNKSLGHGPE
jgi:hypothetical protein